MHAFPAQFVERQRVALGDAPDLAGLAADEAEGALAVRRNFVAEDGAGQRIGHFEQKAARPLGGGLGPLQLPRPFGDARLKRAVRLLERRSLPQQRFAHAFLRARQFADFAPRRGDRDRRGQFEAADAGALRRQLFERPAETRGQTRGGDHADEQRKAGQRQQQVEIGGCAGNEIRLRRENRQPEGLPADADAPEQAVPVGAVLPELGQTAIGAAAGAPETDRFVENRHTDRPRILQDCLLDFGIADEARVARHGEHPAGVVDDGRDAGPARRLLGGEMRQVEQLHVVRQDVAAAVGAAPARGDGDARLLRGEEDVGRRPRDRTVLRQRLRGLEPGAGARVVAEFAHLNRFDLPLARPGDPPTLPPPARRVADAIHPFLLGGLQQQDFTPALVGEDDRRDFRMIGDHGEEELVEAQQLVVLQAALFAPAAASVEGDFDALQQALHARLELLGGLPHLRVGQLGDGRRRDQEVGAAGEQHEHQQNLQEAADDEAAADRAYGHGGPGVDCGRVGAPEPRRHRALLHSCRPPGEWQEHLSAPKRCVRKQPSPHRKGRSRAHCTALA